MIASTNTTPPAANGAQDIVEDFLASKPPLTARAYGQDLADLARFLDVATTADAVDQLLACDFGGANRLGLRFRNWLEHDRHLGPATINRRLACLKSVVGLAHQLGQVPFRLNVPTLPTITLRDCRGPSLQAVREMIHRARYRNDWVGRRDRAILLVLFVLGLRSAELRGLDVADVDFDASSLWVLRKGDRQKRPIRTPLKLMEALTEWIALGGLDDGAPLFPNGSRVPGHHEGANRGRLSATGLWGIVHGYGRTVGVRVSPHGLRHAGTTQAAQSERFGVGTMAAWIGHRDVKTLSHYLDPVQNVAIEVADHLAEAVFARA